MRESKAKLIISQVGKLIDEFLAAWYHWTHYRRNGKSKKEQLEDMDRDIDYENIELEEEEEKEESEDQRQD